MNRLRRIGIGTLFVGVWGLAFAGEVRAEPNRGEAGPGALDAVDPEGRPIGLCPLKHTDVQVEVSGFVARVNVTQQFHNPYGYKIEAVYTFPLSQDAAVDDMTMIVGDRVIRGLIKERTEAREIYENAKRAGHVAGLLDQERPNIFTQRVANIEPGAAVEIRISYVEHLDWEDGVYGFDFPMVVGPRYIPGGAIGKCGTGWAPDTDQVPDASRITPPITPPGTRSGHDVSLAVNLNAGCPIQHVQSLQHEVELEYGDADHQRATIRLKEQAVIPNRDFVLKFQTATQDITDALLAHTDERGNFFTLILQPPERVRPEWIVPKEMIFVIDKSGSMRGFPIETAKQAMRMCIENLNPDDTFNLMTFAGGVGFCFERPVPNTKANRRRALEYLRSLRGSGGTEMMNAIHACLGGDKDPEKVRIVCFMTDGYVGNDMAIIDAVRKNAGTARVFSFGIGTSVNRFLLDGMARAGRGEVEYVLSSDQASEASMRFYERVSTPVLTDVEIDFSGLLVEEVFPKRIPDLFSAKPVVISGRYLSPGRGHLTLRGRRGKQPFSRLIEVEFPAEAPENGSLASLWARAKVDDLMHRDLLSVQQGLEDPGLKERVVDLALEYRLLTQYTSFVAVEETTVTRDGELVTVTVPVEMPQGVSYEGVFGLACRDALKKSACRSRPVGAVSFCQPAPQLLGERASSAGRGGSNLFAGDADEAAELDVSGLPRAIELRIDRSTMQVRKPSISKREQVLSQKLAGGLRDLANRVGPDGDFAQGRILVRKGRVEVAVHLADLSDATLARLKALGVVVLTESKVRRNLLIGTIALEKLEELALLEVVQRIEPTAWSTLK